MSDKDNKLEKTLDKAKKKVTRKNDLEAVLELTKEIDILEWDLVSTKKYIKDLKEQRRKFIMRLSQEPDFYKLVQDNMKRKK